MITAILNSFFSNVISNMPFAEQINTLRKPGHVNNGPFTSSSASGLAGAKSLKMERMARSWTAILIALYLGAIVTANLLVSRFGPRALPFSAFLLIPFDLCTRDLLHERWEWRMTIIKTASCGPSESTVLDGWIVGGGMAYKITGGGLLWKMGILIATGSTLSYIVAPASGRIAIASMAAFGVAATIDTAAYSFAADWKKFHRMNFSNLFSSIADSILFPVIAFGSTTLMLSTTQSAAKFFGGILWSALFVWILRRRHVRN